MLILYTLFFVGLSSWFLRQRSFDLDSRCKELLSKLTPNTYQHLADILDEYQVDEDNEFWDGLGRLDGLFAALRQSFVHLALIQALRDKNQVAAKESRYVWCRIVLQVWYTVLAIPSAAISWLCPTYPHAAAFFAVKVHRQIMDRMMSLTLNVRTPGGVCKLAEIL